ncbi:hypothetical protein J4456_02515 [Candidatus Pacearchaeota archaeon]|nr:hypothetical protein [Candidatus Pacearchaeota archaeon]
MNELITKIKQNKKYNSIADNIIKKEIQRYIQKNKEPVTKKDIQILIKNVRAQLHRLYASYQTKKKSQIQLLLGKLKSAIHDNDSEKIKDCTNELLSITISTKERLPKYKEIYEKIFEITGKPKIICDFGSGLNPFSIPLINIPHVAYYAYDIDEKDVTILNDYFQIMKHSVDGKAEVIDLEYINWKKIPTSDLILMFKVIDLIDTKSKRKNKISEEIIINALNGKTKNVIASFATRTLTRKPMNLPRRIGFEKMLERNKLQFQTFSIENEIFYVISKE